VEQGEPHRAQGRLSYEPQRGIELSVVDLRADFNEYLNSRGPIPVFHGHTLQGKPCTLFDAIPISSEAYPFGGHSREFLTSNRLVHGMHLEKIDDLVVDHAIIGVRGLREWVNHYWVPSGDGEGEPPGRISRFLAALRSRLPFATEPLAPHGDLLRNEVLNVPLDGAHLLFQRRLGTPDGTLAQNKAEAHLNARFELDHPLAYPEFVERIVRPLLDLIVLATHEESEVEATTILIPTELVKWWGDEKPISSVEDVAVIERTSVTASEPREHAFERIPMPLRAWGPEAAAVIGRWFALRNKLGGPGNLLFATLNKRGANLENDTLSLLSVAEGYHRAFHDQPPFSDSDHEAALAAMIDTLAEGRQRQHYRDRLRHANQQSQKRRVRDLFERAEQVLPEVEGWRRTQLQPLINTRNFLTHWGERSDDVLEDWDLWDALNRVRIVIEINLYLDLGIDPETIEIAIRTANHRRAFLEPA
jgi:hypothetical protein